MDNERLEDDETAASDVAALRVFERLVARSAQGGLLQAEELAESRAAVEQLRSLIVDWHGEEVVDLLSAEAAGVA